MRSAVWGWQPRKGPTPSSTPNDLGCFAWVKIAVVRAGMRLGQTANKEDPATPIHTLCGGDQEGVPVKEISVTERAPAVVDQGQALQVQGCRVKQECISEPATLTLGLRRWVGLVGNENVQRFKA